MKRYGVLLLLGVLLFVGVRSLAEAASPIATVAETSASKTVVAAPPTRVVDQPTALLNAFRQNDFAGLQQAMSGNNDLAKIADEWDQRAQASRAAAAEKAAAAKANPAATADAMQALLDDRAQDAWNKLQTDAGVDLLVDELQPMIAEDVSKTVLEFNLGMGASLMAIADDKSLTAQDVQQLTQLLYAVQAWTGRTDFADRERLRRALKSVSHLVRQTGLKNYEDIRGLSFEDAVVHGDALISTVKQVFAAYDLDIDAILNSVRIDEVNAFDDKATLRIEARVFGVGLAHDFPMQYYQGDWIGIGDAADRERWRGQSEDGQDDGVAAAAAAAAASQAMNAAAADIEADLDSEATDAGSTEPTTAGRTTARDNDNPGARATATAKE